MSALQTIDAESAARQRWDVLFVGAGPAGGMAALLLARHGRRVLLVDRAAFPRAKVCGCCLNACSLAALDGAGAGARVRRVAQPLQSFQLCVGRSRTQLALRDSVAVSRSLLDSALVEAAIAAGAEFLPRTPVRAARSARSVGESPAIVVENAHAGTFEIAAGAIILACGLDGRVDGTPWTPRIVPRSRIGLSAVIDDYAAQYAPHVIHMALSRGGYAGLVHLENGRLNVAAAVFPGFLRACGSASRAISRILSDNRLPIPECIAAARWTGTPALTRRPGCVAGDGVFLVGDAAGYVEPFTGEGIGWALHGAQLLCHLLSTPPDAVGTAAARTWQALFDRHIRPRQWRCGLVAAALRRPAALTPLIALANCASPIRACLAALVDRPFAALPSGSTHTMDVGEPILSKVD